MGRVSIVGAAETSVGKVREHNEDAHFIDPERGIFAVCDGMGGHAAGEVASDLAVHVVRDRWASEATLAVMEAWLERGTLDARKQMLATINAGVLAAHEAILAEAGRDKSKAGMGTTIIGALVIGGDIVFAQCGDSRAYMVRDGIAMQLTEDHTLLARLLAAGVEIDTSNEGSRFKSMLTNALGIGSECKVASFIVPLADGDRFLLCSDGITEYVQEAEIGEVITQQPSPARAAQRLVELALQRGGADNATALVIRVLEAGETARPAEQLQRENKAINKCPLWAKVTPQGRLRALRIALPRDHALGDKIPAQTLGDRVAWIIVDGEVDQEGVLRGPGSLLYPEALLKDAPLPDKLGLAIARSEVRALALRCDDFYEVCEDDSELGELLLAALAAEIATRRRPISSALPRLVVGVTAPGLEGATTDPNMEVFPAARRSTPSQPPAMAAGVVPAVAKATAPRLGRTPTPFAGIGPLLRQTAPMGVVGLTSGPVPPVSGGDDTLPPPFSDRAGPGTPAVLRPRTSTQDGPGVNPRAVGPSGGLGDRDPRSGQHAPAPRSQPPRNEEDDPEVVIEADEPPEMDTVLSKPAANVVRSNSDHSEPEISIERFSDREVEEPLNVPERDEGSAPEITIISNGRPITADDSVQVSGSIDVKKA